jgi:hypothetical protein
MKSVTLAATAAVFLATTAGAHATGSHDNVYQGASAAALSRAASSVVSGQFTTVRAALEHHASTTATGGNAGAMSGGNQQSVTIEGAAAPDLGDRVPDVTAIPGNTTARCYVGVGVGVGFSGFGGSIGGAVFDEGCDANRDAVMLAGMGEPDAAIRRLCDEADTRKALADRCSEVGFVATDDDDDDDRPRFGMRDK